MHYNGSNSFKVNNGVGIYKFKLKNSEINTSQLWLSNISKECLVDNMKKSVLYGYKYHFSINYDSSDVDDILDIHKFLIKKHCMK